MIFKSRFPGALAAFKVRLPRLCWVRSCLLLGLIAGLTASAQAKVHLKISALPLIVESFTNWTAATPWEQINQFAGPDSHQGTVDLILQLQALKAGGLDFDYEFAVSPNNGRAVAEMSNGSVDLNYESFWDIDISPDTMLKTEATIRDGDTEKGIYALASNDKIMKVTSLEELGAFIPVTVSTWPQDVKTLEAMGLKNLQKPPKIENVVAMIQAHHADFTLLEFSSNPDLSDEINGVKLVPVPNCKVAIHASRCWAVSKASPHSQEIFRALNKGLKLLRQEGRIERAFQESGLINKKVAAWKRLY